MPELYLAIGCILGLLASVAAARILLVRIPADYFADPSPEPGEFRYRHPVVRWTVRVLKNLLGVVLITAGLVMLVTPGPGLIAAVLGLSLLDLPGKRALQQRIIGYGPVLKAINRARARRGHAPLEVQSPRTSLSKSSRKSHSAGSKPDDRRRTDAPNQTVTPS